MRRIDSDRSSGFSTSTAAGSRPARSRSPGARNVVVQASSNPAPARMSRIRRRSRWRAVSPPDRRGPRRHGPLDPPVAPHAGHLLDHVDLPLARRAASVGTATVWTPGATGVGREADRAPAGGPRRRRRASVPRMALTRSVRSRTVSGPGRCGSRDVDGRARAAGPRPPSRRRCRPAGRRSARPRPGPRSGSTPRSKRTRASECSPSRFAGPGDGHRGEPGRFQQHPAGGRARSRHGCRP